MASDEVLHERLAQSHREVETLQDRIDAILRRQEEKEKDVETMKAAYLQLRVEHDKVQRVNQDVSNRLEIANKAKENLRRECEQYYKQWGEQMKQQQEEHAATVAEMMTEREVQQLRIRLTRDLEGKHKQQTDEMMGEIERYQEMYFRERKSHELLRTEMDQLKLEHAQLVQEMNNRHQSVVRELLDKNGRLQGQIEDMKDRDESIKLRRQKEELALSVKKLQQEVAAVREEKEKVLSSGVDARLQHVREMQKLKGELLVEENDKRLYMRRSQELGEELVNARAAALQLQQEVERLKYAVASADKQHTLHEQELNELRNRHAAEKRAQESRNQHGLERLRMLQEQATDRLAKVTSERDAFVHKLATAEREGAERVQRVEADTAQRVWRVEQEKSDLEERNADLAAKLSQEQQLRAEENESIRREMDTARADLRVMAMRADSLEEKLQTKEQVLTQLRSDYEARVTETRELESEHALLQSKHREVLEQLHAQSVEHDKVVRDRDYLKGELETISEEIEEERKTHLEAVEESRTVFNRERDILQRRANDLERELAATQRDSHAALEEAKRGKNRYKKMALVLRARVAEVVKEAAAARKEASVQMQTRNFELRSLGKQLREAERQRDELKLRLTMGPAFHDAAMGDGLGAFTPNVIDVENQAQQEITNMLSRLHEMRVGGAPDLDGDDGGDGGDDDKAAAASVPA